MIAWDEDRPLLELLKDDQDVTKHLDPDEIDRCFDLSRYLERADVIFERLEEL
jgi:adenylosuccinate lyase